MGRTKNKECVQLYIPELQYKHRGCVIPMGCVYMTNIYKLNPMGCVYITNIYKLNPSIKATWIGKPYLHPNTKLGC